VVVRPKTERRRFPRYRTDLPVTVLNRLERNLEGHCEVISEGGLGVTLAKAVAEGNVVLLQFAVPTHSTPFRVWAMVRNLSGLQHGLEFISITEGERLSIRQLCNELAIQSISGAQTGSDHPLAEQRQKKPYHKPTVKFKKVTDADPSACKRFLHPENKSPERRRFPRFSCFFPVELRSAGQSYPTCCETTNISLRGCYVRVLFPLPVGTAVDIRIGMAGREIQAKGVVKTLERALGNGVEFTDMDYSHRLQLQQYLTG
jgi:PilZ domain